MPRDDWVLPKCEVPTGPGNVCCLGQTRHIADITKSTRLTQSRGHCPAYSITSGERPFPKRDNELMLSGEGNEAACHQLGSWPRGGSVAVLARGQQSGKPLRSSLRVGLVAIIEISAAQDALIQRLAELGFVEGQNLSFDHENAFPEFLDAHYANIVKRGADILLAPESEPILKSAVRAAAGRMPVVFVAIDYDPLKSGYVASLARPGRT